MPGHPRLGVRIVVDAACFARVDPARDAAFDRGSGRGSRPGVPAGVRDRLAARGDRSARPRAPGSRAPSRRRSIFDFPLAFFPENRRPIARVARRSQPLVRHLCRGNIPFPPKKVVVEPICQPSRALVAHTRAHSALHARRSRTPRPPPRLARHAPRTFAVARAEASASSPTHSAAERANHLRNAEADQVEAQLQRGPVRGRPGRPRQAQRRARVVRRHRHGARSPPSRPRAVRATNPPRRVARRAEDPAPRPARDLSQTESSRDHPSRLNRRATNTRISPPRRVRKTTRLVGATLATLAARSLARLTIRPPLRQNPPRVSSSTPTATRAGPCSDVWWTRAT